jgi:hypothetical protein
LEERELPLCAAVALSTGLNRQSGGRVEDLIESLVCNKEIGDYLNLTIPSPDSRNGFAKESYRQRLFWQKTATCVIHVSWVKRKEQGVETPA